MRYALVLALAVAACTPAAKAPGFYTNFPDPRGRELVLGVGDLLSINVWDQKDLNTEATVRPDGTITIPLVGDIKAQGQTTTALKAQITKALANYVKLGGGNEITVAVKTYVSYRFTVQGEVSRPGQYNSVTYLRVSDVIALAGGPTRFAKRGAMIIMRQDAKGEGVSIPIDYDLVASGKRPDMNIWILADDVIYVP